MFRAITSSRRDLLFIVIASTLWGTTGVATQSIYNTSSANPLSVAFLRLAICALVLVLLGWWQLGRRMWYIKPRDTLLLLSLGAMQALFQFSYLAAIPDCGITVATLIALCVAPVLVVLFSAFVLHERLTRRILLALLCALGGTILLTGTSGVAGNSAHFFTGILFSLLCATSYAGVILIGRTLSHRYHPLQINTAAFGIGALVLLACSLSMHLVLSYTSQDWLLLLYLGSIPTALAYTLFQAGVRSTSATLTSILTLCEPLTAAILAWILFGERLGPLGIVGALLLLGTIILLAQGKSVPQDPHSRFLAHPIE
jgi:drug/metabolite transporter, DME family